VLDTPFSPWPSFSEEEANAIRQVLLSNRVNYWTGTECRSFEQEFASWSETRYAVALANGTVALDLSLKALGVGQGDEVVVTPRTFIASASCVVNAGAKPVFADVDPDSGNLSAKTIEAVLTPDTKAIICVHLSGWPCDMDPIMALAKKHNLLVIEDCAQAHGARYKGRSVGSIGHVGAWSFCQDKIMTTGGEGGMVTTNDEMLWRRMWSYKDHGKSYEAVYERKHAPGFRWLHESFGTNWRMTELQAAIGRIQLRRMSEWSTQRKENAEKFRKALAPFSQRNGVIRLPFFKDQIMDFEKTFSPDRREKYVHGNYKFYAYVRPENLRTEWSRDRIIDEINAQGVPCYQGSCSEVYLEKAFCDAGIQPKKSLPSAKILGETSLMFLIHPTLTAAEMDQATAATSLVLSKSSR
tara:strand:+ start:28159 stop:29391 length:1233 start_codon:yes stop_codon:yes gene_type:complete